MSIFVSDLLPTTEGEDGEEMRTCWACDFAYADNVSEGNPEARCPACEASQVLCSLCGEPGAEECIHGCESAMCTACWPGHPNEAETGPCPGGVAEDPEGVSE